MSPSALTVDQIQALWNQRLAPQAGPLAVRVVLAILALLVVALTARLALGATRRALSRTRAHANARLLVDRVIEGLAVAVAVIWVLAIFGIQVTGAIAFLGVAGLAVSLALQDVLRNLIAGLYLLVEHPFTIGDQIKFRDFIGVVENIELRTTALRTAAGQRVVIPNAMLFADALVNRSAYGRQQVRLRVAVPLDGAQEDGQDRQDGAKLLEHVRNAVESAADQGRNGSSPHVAVLVESLSAEKATLRAELETENATAVAPEVAWAVRAQLPRSEVTILE